MDKTTAADKLSKILEFSEIDSLQKLAEEIGASKQNMYDIMKGKCGLSKTMKERILTKYPKISRDWLDGLSDIMISNSPSISTHATGNSNASVHISGNRSNNGIEKDIEIGSLRKEIEMLKTQLEEEKNRSAQYWDMIQKLMK